MHIHARGLMSRSLLSRACSSEHFLRRYPRAPAYLRTPGPSRTFLPPKPRSPCPVPALPRAHPFPLLAPYLPRNPSHIVPVLGGAREFVNYRFLGGSGGPRRVPEALNSRIHVVFRSPRRPPEAPGGSRRHLEAPGGSRKLPDTPGDSRRLPNTRRGLWKLPKAPKGSRTPLHTPEGSRRP